MTLKQIENEILIAPIRFFKDFEVRGYFAPELREKFGVTDAQMKQMFRMRSTFGWKYKTLNGEQKFFFYLRT